MVGRAVATHLPSTHMHSRTTQLPRIHARTPSPRPTRNVRVTPPTTSQRRQRAARAHRSTHAQPPSQPSPPNSTCHPPLPTMLLLASRPRLAVMISRAWAPMTTTCKRHRPSTRWTMCTRMMRLHRNGCCLRMHSMRRRRATARICLGIISSGMLSLCAFVCCCCSCT